LWTIDQLQQSPERNGIEGAVRQWIPLGITCATTLQIHIRSRVFHHVRFHIHAGDNPSLPLHQGEEHSIAHSQVKQPAWRGVCIRQAGDTREKWLYGRFFE